MRFSKFIATLTSLLILLILMSFRTGLARALYDNDELASGVPKPAAGSPYVQAVAHTIGKIGLAVTNMGQFGTGFLTSDGGLPSCRFPYPGPVEYLFAGSFWIGAVVGRDTLVSMGADGWQRTQEMWPDPEPKGMIIERSILDASDPLAISEQDYIAIYTDTVTDPGFVVPGPLDGPFKPLNIEVTQRSYAWSYAYAEDFVLFDYGIKNIGRRTLTNTYMAFYVDADVKTGGIGSQVGFDDDICGFKEAIPSDYGCGFIDTVKLAWIADNDGKQLPADNCPFGVSSLTAVTATRVVRTPSDSLKYSFNWWISNGNAALDFGPRKAGTPEDPFRDFGGFLGTPEGTRNKYYIMRHVEFDYDQLYTALDHTGSGWLPRPPSAGIFADGYDTRYLLAFGPFDIDPGEVLPISFAYIAGEDFHTRCEAFNELFDPDHPEIFDNYLNFADLGKNAMWASWIYDNPGLDTDGDKNRGKYRMCAFDSIEVCEYDTISTDPLEIDTVCFYQITVADTVYYEGDGVPDFRGASPPPAPELWVVDSLGDTLRSRVIARVGELRVRWNGIRSENEKDVFSNMVDFEGYRVRKSFAPRGSEFSILASYDIEDYTRYVWNRNRATWDLRDTPFKIDSLKILYGEDFDPLAHGRDNPLNWNDTSFYFIRQDWNQSDLRDTLQIHKVYPDQPPPTTLDIDSARQYYADELTDDSLYFKYYEYEYVIRNLLPSQLSYVAVTAFDYGSPSSGLASLETPAMRNFVAEYPQNPASVVEKQNLKVIVYPNPWRADGKYKEYGFEGRDYIDNQRRLIPQDLAADDKIRAINFINLPHKCTIRIFSIDGDLIREIEHDVPLNYPQSSYERWDVITRNTQAVVSGIYYYSVESDMGNQIGKIVIIM